MVWFRQVRGIYPLPWHIPSPVPPRAALAGLRQAACGSTMQLDDRDIEVAENPPVRDRCAACQGMFVRGEA